MCEIRRHTGYSTHGWAIRPGCCNTRRCSSASTRRAEQSPALGRRCSPTPPAVALSLSRLVPLLPQYKLVENAAITGKALQDGLKARQPVAALHQLVWGSVRHSRSTALLRGVALDAHSPVFAGPFEAISWGDQERPRRRCVWGPRGHANTQLAGWSLTQGFNRAAVTLSSATLAQGRWWRSTFPPELSATPSSATLGRGALTGRAPRIGTLLAAPKHAED